MPDNQQNQQFVQPNQIHNQPNPNQVYPNSQQAVQQNPVFQSDSQPVSQNNSLPSADSIINGPATPNNSEPSKITLSNHIQEITIQFLIGFVTLWIVLWIHAYATLSQYFGMVSEVQTALYISLAMSIVLLVIFAIISVGCILWWKKPFILVGAIIAIPVAHAISSAIQEGFAIFFEFI